MSDSETLAKQPIHDVTFKAFPLIFLMSRHTESLTRKRIDSIKELYADNILCAFVYREDC